MEPDRGDLSREAAQSLLKLDFSKPDHERVAELSVKANEGVLTVDEKEELDEYMRVADLLALLQLKARNSLNRNGA